MLWIDLLILLLSGYFILQKIFPQQHLLENLGLGYLLGWGFFSWSWFMVYWLLGIPITFNSAQVLLLLSLGGALAFNPKGFAQLKTESKRFVLEVAQTPTLLFGFMAFLIISLSILIQDLHWPARDWDSLVLYDFRAKVFASTGQMQPAISMGYFFGYPLFTSLGHTLWYLNQNNHPAVFHLFIFLALVLTVTGGLLQQKISRTAILVMSILLLTHAMFLKHTTMTYTNLSYVVFIALAYRQAAKAIIEDNKRTIFTHWILAFVLAALSIWCRSTEPFWIPLLVLYVGFHKKLMAQKYFWVALAAGLVSLALLKYSWNIFETQSLYLLDHDPSYLKLNQGSNNDAIPFAWSQLFNIENFSLERFKNIQDVFYVSIYSPRKLFFIIWLWLLALNAGDWAIQGRFAKTQLYWNLATFACLSLIEAGMFYLSLSFKSWNQIPDSVSRMGMFLDAFILFQAMDYWQSIEAPLKEKWLGTRA